MESFLFFFTFWAISDEYWGLLLHSSSTNDKSSIQSNHFEFNELSWNQWKHNFRQYWGTDNWTAKTFFSVFFSRKGSDIGWSRAMRFIRYCLCYHSMFLSNNNKKIVSLSAALTGAVFERSILSRFLLMSRSDIGWSGASAVWCTVYNVGIN